MAKTIGSRVSPADAVRRLNRATAITSVQRRPNLSARIPKRTVPNIMPTREALARNPACVESILRSAMIAGNAAPVMAIS